MAAQPQRPRSTGLSDRRRGSFGVVPPLDESKVLRRYISTPKIGIRRPERRPQRELSFRLNDWPAVSMGLRSETGTSVMTEDREGGEQGQHQLQEEEREELSRLLEGQVGGFAASSSLGGRRRRGASPEARARREKRDFASLRHVADRHTLTDFLLEEDQSQAKSKRQQRALRNRQVLDPFQQRSRTLSPPRRSFASSSKLTRTMDQGLDATRRSMLTSVAAPDPEGAPLPPLTPETGRGRRNRQPDVYRMVDKLMLRKEEEERRERRISRMRQRVAAVGGGLQNGDSPGASAQSPVLGTGGAAPKKRLPKVDEREKAKRMMEYVNTVRVAEALHLSPERKRMDEGGVSFLQAARRQLNANTPMLASGSVEASLAHYVQDNSQHDDVSQSWMDFLEGKKDQRKRGKGKNGADKRRGPQGEKNGRSTSPDVRGGTVARTGLCIGPGTREMAFLKRLQKKSLRPDDIRGALMSFMLEGLEKAPADLKELQWQRFKETMQSEFERLDIDEELDDVDEMEERLFGQFMLRGERRLAYLQENPDAKQALKERKRRVLESRRKNAGGGDLKFGTDFVQLNTRRVNAMHKEQNELAERMKERREKMAEETRERRKLIQESKMISRKMDALLHDPFERAKRKQEEERQANELARLQDRQMQWLTIVTVGARMNWIMSKLENREVRLTRETSVLTLQKFMRSVLAKSKQVKRDLAEQTLRRNKWRFVLGYRIYKKRKAGPKVLMVLEEMFRLQMKSAVSKFHSRIVKLQRWWKRHYYRTLQLVYQVMASLEVLEGVKGEEISSWFMEDVRKFVRSLHRMHYERERERHKQRAENVPALERQDSRDRKFQLSKRQRDGKEKAHIKALLSYVSPAITSDVKYDIAWEYIRGKIRQFHLRWREYERRSKESFFLTAMNGEEFEELALDSPSLAAGDLTGRTPHARSGSPSILRKATSPRGGGAAPRSLSRTPSPRADGGSGGGPRSPGSRGRHARFSSIFQGTKYDEALSQGLAAAGGGSPGRKLQTAGAGGPSQHGRFLGLDSAGGVGRHVRPHSQPSSPRGTERSVLEARPTHGRVFTRASSRSMLRTIMDEDKEEKGHGQRMSPSLLSPPRETGGNRRLMVHTQPSTPQGSRGNSPSEGATSSVLTDTFSSEPPHFSTTFSDEEVMALIKEAKRRMVEKACQRVPFLQRLLPHLQESRERREFNIIHRLSTGGNTRGSGGGGTHQRSPSKSPSHGSRRR